MKTRSLRRLEAALCTSIAVTLAPLTAASAAPVDVRARLLFEHRSHTGRTLPFFAPSREFESSGRAPLLVRFARAITPAERASWEKLGLRIGRRLSSGATKVKASRRRRRWPQGDAPLDVKVEVIDADGWTARASARIRVAPTGAGGAGGAGGGAPPADDDGCGCDVPGRATHGLGEIALLAAFAGAAMTRRRAAPRARSDPREW
jgi:hypothetical protein